MIRPLLLAAFDYRVFRGFALVWMALIFYLSAQPSLGLPGLFEGQDKVMHFVTYGVLGFLVARGIGPVRGEFSWRRMFAAIAFTVAYGISDEFHQSFVPGRSPSVFDLLADALGALAGAWFARHLGEMPARAREDNDVA